MKQIKIDISLISTCSPIEYLDRHHFKINLQRSRSNHNSVHEMASFLQRCEVDMSCFGADLNTPFFQDSGTGHNICHEDGGRLNEHFMYCIPTTSSLQGIVPESILMCRCLVNLKYLKMCDVIVNQNDQHFLSNYVVLDLVTWF